jgi:murein DD-endopeptidase MepM/ murein hydrolase activator NlpD
MSLLGRLTRQRTTRPQSASRRAARARRLHCEALEDRRMLANLFVVDAYLVDSAGSRVNEVVIGQKIGVRLDWRTKDLPAGIASYQVEFRVDGVPLRSDDITYGAGQTSPSFWWYKTGWYASPGPHNVEVVLDVDNDVPENNETDNTFAFAFTPITASFPQRMIWPMELQPFEEAFWINYNDINPTSSHADLMGGNATYDGHNGIDVGPTYYARQDQGVDIYAAADGVVLSINDGEFDRETENDGGTSNFVILDHGNGWQTHYYHMRRDSVQVNVGQAVSQGDKLGLVASSGSSGSSHLHFEVRYRGLAVETHFDQATYWATLRDYVFDHVRLIDAGIANYPVGEHFWEGPSDIDVLAQQSGIRLYGRGLFSGLQTGDVVQMVWRRPSGTTYTTRTVTMDRDWSKYGWGGGGGVNLPSNPDLGSWRVDYLVNGNYVGQEFFLVQPQAPQEIRVEEASGQIIVDGRFTPIDFGATSVGAPPATRTFAVINHGYSPLSIDALDLPAGFTLTEGLSASIAPGASDSFTVARDTAAGGNVAGAIKIFSNDDDEAIYNFAVEGRVQSAGVGNLIVGISEFEMYEGGRIVANVRRTGSMTSGLTVALSTDDPTEITLPATVTFLPGSDYAQFFIEAPSDFDYDGLQHAAVVATAAGYHSGRNSVGVVEQIGDFTGDGLVTGNDFLAWQRGLSPNPLSIADLGDWRAHYGNQPPVTAALVAEATLASQAVREHDERLVDLPFYLLGTHEEFEDPMGIPAPYESAVAASNRIARDDFSDSAAHTKRTWPRLAVAPKQNRKVAFNDFGALAANEAFVIPLDHQ